MRDIIKNILKEELNEGVKDVVIGLASLLTLGLSKAQAQDIKNNQPKLKLIDTLITYNKNPMGMDSLKSILMPKIGDKTNLFIENYLEIQPDGTVVVKPSFVDGLKINYNPKSKETGFTYVIKF